MPIEQNAPAAQATIDQTLHRLDATGNRWLGDYWRQADGCLLADQVTIYATGDIEERNRTFEVAQYFPGLVAIGDDSGGRLILMAKSGHIGFQLIDSGNPTLDHAEHFASLDELVASILSE